MKTNDLIVFDMDGVLVDVSASYRDVVRYTARQFFRGAPSWEKLPDPMFSLADLAAVKQSGGLNNDWDLTALVIDLLFGRVKTPAIAKTADNWQWLNETMGRCGLDALIRFLQENASPLTKLWQEKCRPDNEFVRALYSGDVGSGNVIKQIFQEVYLGRTLFVSTYHLPPKLYQADGYIYREKLLVSQAVLAKLSTRHILAIATGRPRKEADFALDYFSIKKYFRQVYSLDDCLREEQRIRENDGKSVSVSKPHPFMLDAIAAATRGTAAHAYYIGDMPDDMAAAASTTTGYTAVGLLHAAPEKDKLAKELKRAGADYIIENIAELFAIVGSD